MKKVTKVVGAVIFDSQIDSYFIGQRSRLKKHPLKWEFIGGKVEKEDLLKAIEREFMEEVGKKIKALRLLHSVKYDYGGDIGVIEINFIECEKFKGKPQFDRSVYEICNWVPRNKLAALDWIDADKNFAMDIAKQVKSKNPPEINISLVKAKPEKLFYFVVTGVIFHPKLKKCLILQRSKKEIAHPGLWGVIGGKLEWDDLRNNPITRKNFDILDWEGMVEKLILREAKEECSLEVYDPRYLVSVAYLRTDGVPTICCKFAVKRKKGKVKLAPEFDDFVWVDEKEVKKYKCIQGIPEEVAKTIKIYNNPC